MAGDHNADGGAGEASRTLETWAQRRWLWVGFGVVHAVLVASALRHGAAALSDVTQVYEPWARQAVTGHGVVGVDKPWVYPLLALVPVLAPAVAGTSHYLTAWLVMVIMLDGVALGVLTRHRLPAASIAAWWWLLFLLLLGPIAIGRIDSVAAALAVTAVSVIASQPRAAHVLLTAAMWIKVWPVAVIAAAVTTLGQRRQAVVTLALSTGTVIAVAAASGGLSNVFRFVTAQNSRNLQIEAPVSIAWMWVAALHPGVTPTAGHAATRQTVRVFYDVALRTEEVHGPGTGAAGVVVTILMPAAFVAVALLGWAALRWHRAVVVFPNVAMAMVLTLLVFDKVGSPQYQTWLAAPVVAGLLFDPARMRVTAVSVRGLAVLTDAIYPYLTANLRVAAVAAGSAAGIGDTDLTHRFGSSRAG